MFAGKGAAGMGFEAVLEIGLIVTFTQLAKTIFATFDQCFFLCPAPSFNLPFSINGN